MSWAKRQIWSILNSVATLRYAFNCDLMHLHNSIKGYLGTDIVKTDEAKK